MSMHRARLRSQVNEPTPVVMAQIEQLSYWIDTLTDNQQDWISHLPPDWEVEWIGSGRVGDATLATHLQASHNLAQLVACLTSSLQSPSSAQPQSQLQIQSQPIIIAQHTYWCYTCCLRVVGIGRARLVLNFEQPQSRDLCLALITNRLDWSPRTILTQWLQQSVPTTHPYSLPAPAAVSDPAPELSPDVRSDVKALVSQPAISKSA